MDKRITLFGGHYGSGKSNIAVNYAISLADQGKKVALADLDIVNPYFRSADSRGQLEAKGIDLITSDYANSNVDMPAMPQGAYGLLHNPGRYAVIDVGGDDRGALALGRYRDGILEENDFAFLMVINYYRPLAREIDDAVEILKEIEGAAGLPISGLVNNSNLGMETTADTLLNSTDYAKILAEKMGVPLVMTTVEETLFPELQDKIPDLFPLSLQKRNFF